MTAIIKVCSVWASSAAVMELAKWPQVVLVRPMKVSHMVNSKVLDLLQHLLYPDNLSLVQLLSLLREVILRLRDHLLSHLLVHLVLLKLRSSYQFLTQIPLMEALTKVTEARCLEAIHQDK